ncbi:hypothetical protein PR202_gb16603 [Eleusine coracana subsp. coracana]|uniref:non-specific serine/threonine protein kinase n=1 Tax=Eleusine coracana subsp. coracana TaxID=191504 RepID=A0AAV5F0P2_ELECO|nr:hypothetical protein PR202_gb16603 [Eleusine coracana subsp. coracana]
MKSVYRGFDEARGVEVAWNQASLTDVLRTPDAVQRMYAEVQLLRSIRHDSIVSFLASWVHVPTRTFNFITELFSSGTLRSYRLKYPRASLLAVKSWARQVLRGLAHLHARGVVHRDLKCDNLLVNGHLGQVKIADLGLAAVLNLTGDGGRRRSVVGTPEFMAPEMYDEEYDERVDVYAFGMCVLEMVTLQFPYAECSNPAQIYKKVTSGRLPDAFFRVEDDEARRFIGRCLVAASQRPSAAELLMDPFLLDDVDENDDATSSPRRPLPPAPDLVHPTFTTSSNNAVITDDDDDTSCSSSLFSDDHHQEEEEERPPPPVQQERSDDIMMTITGKLNAEEDTIFLKVQITDDTCGYVRNIYFPFDMASDTATEVATEMVKELDITDRDPAEIAAMIEQEIHRLMPAGREQHEYSYYAGHEHDDDENQEQPPPPPFYYLSSSPTSSQGGSLYGGVGSSSSGGFSGPHGSPWSKDHYCSYALSDDDDMSSIHTGKYSALHYDTPGHQEDEALQQAPPGSGKQVESRPSSSSSKAAQATKSTRFGPDGISRSRSPRRADTAQMQQLSSLAHQLQRQCGMSPQQQQPHAGRPRQRTGGEDDDEDRRRRRMSRNRSMVDMRSRLLHRTLVEELNRRLFFNTVGAVENIGFRAPAGYGGSSSSSSTARGRGRADQRGRRSNKEDDKNQRYFML